MYCEKYGTFNRKCRVTDSFVKYFCGFFETPGTPVALYVTLCESGRRYQLQYRFVNPLESDGNIFIDIRLKKKYMIHRRPLENF